MYDFVTCLWILSCLYFVGFGFVFWILVLDLMFWGLFMGDG